MRKKQAEEREKQQAEREKRKTSEGQRKQDDFYHAIDALSPDKFATTTVEDWGTKRGQGKRSGGLVRGAMSDITLQGKKTYTNLIGQLPKDDQNEAHFVFRNRPDALSRYARARAYG